MNETVPLINVTAKNVEETGFFCCMSKRKSPGYQQKLAWLNGRFGEGLTIKLLGGGERGFVETIPGEHAWRAVDAKGYLFIQCLWVVGKSKGKGHGAQLLADCVADAKRRRMKGVAMVTSSRNWLMDRRLLDKHGFECVAEAPPSFQMMVKRFGRAKAPSFPGRWEEKRRRCGKGLSVICSAQCPYIDDAVNIVRDTAAEMGIEFNVKWLESAEEVRELSPTPFGAFGIVRDGRLLSYAYLTKKQLTARLSESEA